MDFLKEPIIFPNTACRRRLRRLFRLFRLVQIVKLNRCCRMERDFDPDHVSARRHAPVQVLPITYSNCLAKYNGADGPLVSASSPSPCFS
jgi:hypothetical protein